MPVSVRSVLLVYISIFDLFFEVWRISAYQPCQVSSLILSDSGAEESINYVHHPLEHSCPEGEVESDQTATSVLLHVAEFQILKVGV